MEVVQGPDNTLEKNLLFEKLVADHQTSLLRTCYLFLRDRGLAEDAVSETFLKAYKNFEGFRGDSSEKTWLMRIAVNVCRDMQRTSWFLYVNRRITPDMLPETADEPEPNEDSLLLEILNLPKKLREVVILYYYQNYDTSEIADLLGIARSSVSSRLQRARTKLREVLERTVRYEQ
ncbi:MAG: sigma-70 family RNA polymerase sigma factor [Bacillota bacterium]|nr:sigma-70 family RNA polymerase sigma factor [Bacillota bacterium]